MTVSYFLPNFYLLICDLYLKESPRHVEVWYDLQLDEMTTVLYLWFMKQVEKKAIKNKILRQ